MISKRIERILLFAKTDYHIRYYGSKLGTLWAFLNPMFKILVYYFVFSTFVFKQRDPDFILYLFIGVITWQFFSEASSMSIKVFVKQRFILQNVKIPKIDFFISESLSILYGYLTNLTIYFLFALILFDPTYSMRLLYIIPIVVGLYAFILGISMFLGTLFIFIRDLIHVWSIVLLAGFWTVPVIWDYHILLENYRFMLYNPMTGYIISLRKVALENVNPDMQILGLAWGISLIVLVGGYLFLKSFSKKAVEFL